MPPTSISDNQRVQTAFFEYLFEDHEGFLCIAYSDADKKNFRQKFFEWPKQQLDVVFFIESLSKKNIWYCTSLLDTQRRVKEACLPGKIVWADLDDCEPTGIHPPPTCVIASSPGRYQAIWKADDIIEPWQQEDWSRRLAYLYNERGADISGWDLTQLLRVPGTYNFKYAQGSDTPIVEVLTMFDVKVPKAVFDEIPKPVIAYTSGVDNIVAMPSLESPLNPQDILYKFSGSREAMGRLTFLYANEPDEGEDWSRILWRLMSECAAIGMSPEEMFWLTLDAKCNKYKRDNRPPEHLWLDCVRAYEKQQKARIVFNGIKPFSMPTIVDADRAQTDTFVHKYCDWAVEATDAIPVYHELGAFMLLSSLLAPGIIYKTSYGEQVPNLWGLVLGDSTLSRKTTAMNMVTELIREIDSDILMMTDGSAEGLLTGLSLRPQKASMFFKDEVSGFFDSINRKDYLAGMPETLTQLYDVPSLYTRMLRKESIKVVKPVFMFFGGGIQDKVYQLIREEYVLSGFLPRFLVVAGTADMSRIRRTGPSVLDLSNKRDKILKSAQELYNLFNGQVALNIGGQQVVQPKQIEAILSPDAWKLYGDIEMMMAEEAAGAPQRELALPTFERMSRSMLKMAVLLAATRGEVEAGCFQVTEQDVINAASFTQRWGVHSVDLLLNAGRSIMERTLAKVLKAVEARPGIKRSDIMISQRYTAKEMNEITATLLDRELVSIARIGKGDRYYPTGDVIPDGKS